MSFYIAWAEGVLIAVFISTRLLVEWSEHRRYKRQRHAFEAEGRYVP